jgi:hypothetical protein
MLSNKFGYLNKFTSLSVISRAGNTRWRTGLKLKKGIVGKVFPDWIDFKC